MELPGAVVLCARHGFEEVAMDIDAELAWFVMGRPAMGRQRLWGTPNLFWTADRNSRAVKRSASMGVRMSS